jgi:hypothetical protein
MEVNTYIYIYVYIYMNIHLLMHVYVHAYMLQHTWILIRKDLYREMHIYVYKHTYINIHISSYIHISNRIGQQRSLSRPAYLSMLIAALPTTIYNPTPPTPRMAIFEPLSTMMGSNAHAPVVPANPTESSVCIYFYFDCCILHWSQYEFLIRPDTQNHDYQKWDSWFWVSGRILTITNAHSQVVPNVQANPTEASVILCVYKRIYIYIQTYVYIYVYI